VVATGDGGVQTLQSRLASLYGTPSAGSSARPCRSANACRARGYPPQRDEGV